MEVATEAAKELVFGGAAGLAAGYVSKKIGSQECESIGSSFLPNKLKIF